MLRQALIATAAAFLACAAAASAQPVTLSTTCGEFRGINPEFLTNIMVTQIESVMDGAVADSVQSHAEWLNQFVSMPGGNTGDVGVRSSQGLSAALRSASGVRISDAQLVAMESRARAKAASLLPMLAIACNANPDRPLLNVMDSVLFRAGYGIDPAVPSYAPSPSLQFLSPKGTTSDAAHREWEQWFASLSGDYKAGAAFWASQRSLPKPGSCRAPNGASRGDFTNGCEVARAMLP
jgi:hypothetical protein